MANPITTSSAFTTSNMKPVSDEVITADWGQKIAENTGALRFKPNIIFQAYDDNSGTTTVAGVGEASLVNYHYFYYDGLHNYLGFLFNGTVRPRSDDGADGHDAYGTLGYIIQGNVSSGTFITTYSEANIDLNTSSTWGSQFQGSQALTPYFSTPGWGTVRTYLYGSLADPSSPNTGTIYLQTFNRFFYTEWV